MASTDSVAGRPVMLYACEGVDPAAWAPAIRAAAPEVELQIQGEDEVRAEDVAFGFAWANPPGFWRQFPNLKAIFSLGAGVDALMSDETLPPDAPVVRMVDPRLAVGMSEFAVMRTLHHHRGLHRYERDQIAQVWNPVRPPLNSQRVVGVMGLGEMGARCALDLAALGFQTRGWSRRPKALEGVHTFHGDEGLGAFAEDCEILICVLPLTPQTRGVLNAYLFSRLAPGACLISIGRGAHLVDDDLLAALDSGQLAAASLDVFETEPLPKRHPFWRHPGVRVTPHVAAFTQPETAAPVLGDNIRRLLRGEPVAEVVDRAAGY